MKIIRLLLNSTGTLEEVDGGSSCQLRWEVGKNSAVLLPRHLAHLIFLMRAACTHTCWCTCWFFFWSCYSFGQPYFDPFSHTHQTYKNHTPIDWRSPTSHALCKEREPDCYSDCVLRHTQRDYLHIGSNEIIQYIGSYGSITYLQHGLLHKTGWWLLFSASNSVLIKFPSTL